MTPSEIIQTVTLAVAGWTLLEVIAQGKAVAVLKQKLRDLPCNKCPNEEKYEI